MPGQGDHPLASGSTPEPQNSALAGLKPELNSKIIEEYREQALFHESEQIQHPTSICFSLKHIT